jgi:hypothetical protein
MDTTVKLTSEIAEDIRLRAKSFDVKTLKKLQKAKEQNGTFDVIISTEVIDRSGEVVKQDGWDLANYKNNPIVLWGHDYYALPIGICIDTYNTTFRGVPALGARGVFLPADINPFAQQVRRMYEYGVKSGYNVGCTTSVGFIPKEFDPDNKTIITRAELLEFSFVPIPANQGVGPAQGRALTFDEAREIGLDVNAIAVKGISFSATIGYVPEDVTTKKTTDTWTKPTLADFTDKKWEELSDDEKTHIAGHFAYTKECPASSFEDLKLPHHRASDGAAVWSAVRAAMLNLMGDRGGIEIEGDRKAVYEHLAAHYKQFGKTAPEFKTLKAAQAGDRCEMDDGSPGVLTTDPNDSDGPLVCMPEEQDKSVVGRESQAKLVKAIADEHERHTEEIGKAFEDFTEKVAGQGELINQDEDDKEKGKKPEPAVRDAVKDLRDAVRDEHAMHRAKSIALFRDFNPAEDKAFDKKEHLKTLRESHDEYEAKNNKTLDDFEDKLSKSVQGEPGSVDEHTDWVTGLIDSNGRSHKKAVTKIAKAMCKAAFGEEDEADEKTLEILREHLSAYVPEPLQRAVFQKIGARISGATKQKLSEAHQHMKAASAIVADLHGGLGDDEGEESRSDGDEKSLPTKAPGKQRSRPTEVRTNNELNAHLFTREVLRDITTAAQRGLETLKKQAKR